ncbi:flagellar hook-length control protein FliK [Arthrobacter sp. CG_A4]|uniref:flagellar hook-length control protein FliK n=1 Tax=Arthrobacter sp. CG_A4 TaxID=3071706 RepID=UPI002E02967E|nr:flagellar hook-length control protein FliK [Arthrobacter sp. CG_A4]
MKGLDLAATLTGPVQGRGTQQGTRSRPEAGGPDAGSFDAVFNDVHNVRPGKAPDADPTVRDALADPAQVPSDASAKDSAAFAGNAQLAAGIAGNHPQATQQGELTAVPGLPVTSDSELSSALSAVAAGATPGPDPRLAVPAALLGGITPAAVAAPAGGTSQAAPSAPAPATPPEATTGATAPTVAHAPLTTPAKGFQAAAPAAAAATATAVPGIAVPGIVVTGNAELQGVAAATAVAPPPATPAPAVTPALLATVMAASGGAAAVAAVGPAEGTTVRTDAAGPADALAAAGAAAAATPANQPGTTPAAAPVPPAPAPAAAQAPSQPGAALQPQLAKPLFTLAGASHGQHIMTLQVTPEDLGPMTVRAHIDSAGVRIELFAPGDAGREAIRGMLPELRKELADAGFGASLDVSEHGGPGTAARGSGDQDADGRDGTGRDGGAGPGSRNGPGDPRPGHRWDALADAGTLRNARILNGAQTTLDILV